MFEPCRDAKMGADRLASDAAGQFDVTLLHNRVYEQVKGQHDEHNDLIRLLDLAERSFQLANDRDHDDEIFAAAETLNSQVEALVDEQVAKACAVIVREADGWSDAWDQTDIDDAKHEAREWLETNEEVARRAGVWEEVVADA